MYVFVCGGGGGPYATKWNGLMPVTQSGGTEVVGCKKESDLTVLHGWGMGFHHCQLRNKTPLFSALDYLVFSVLDVTNNYNQMTSS